MLNMLYYLLSACVWQHWMQPWSSRSIWSYPASGRQKWRRKVPAARTRMMMRRKSRRKMPVVKRRRLDAELLTCFSPHNGQLKVILKLSCFLSAGGSGAVPRGEGELSAAALQVHGRQRWIQSADKMAVYRLSSKQTVCIAFYVEG